jgi:hypothetical protein
MLPRDRKKGYLLGLTLISITALFFFTVVYVDYLRAHQSNTQRAERALVAEAAAEAGLKEAFYQLKRNKNWAAGFDHAALPHNGATYTMTFNRAQSQLPWSTINTASPNPATGWGGRQVPAGAVHLVCVGEYGGAQIQVETIAFVRNTLLEETFDDVPGGGLPEGWVQTKGDEVRTDQGNLIVGNQPGTQGQQVVGGQPDWTDYTVTFRARATGIPEGGWGFYVHTLTEGGRIKSGVLVEFDGNQQSSLGGTFKIRRVGNNGQPGTTLAQTTRIMTPLATWSPTWYQQWHDYKITITGNSFTLYVDGNQVLSATSNQFPQGMIGVNTDPNSQVYIDSVTVEGGDGGGSVEQSAFW